MERRLLRSLTVAVAVATATSLAAPAASAHEHEHGHGHHAKSVTISVMGTSDLHGNVDNWDYFKDAEYDDAAHNDVGLAKISTLISGVRAERGRNRTLLFDSGDTIQGTPLTTYFAKQEPITVTGAIHPMAKAMNAIGYDAITLGNHEYNYGIPYLDKWVSQLHAPVLAANAVDAKTGRQVYQPYVIKTMKVKGQKPIRVGVLGLTNPGIAIWDRDNVTGKQKFLDLVDTAKKWVPRIKARGADVVVVTAHAGDDGMSSYDSKSLNIPTENAAALVAENVKDVDAVLFGHSHKDVPQEFVTNKQTHRAVLLAEPAKWGQRLTVMDFELTKVRGKWTVTMKKSANLNSNTVEADPHIVRLIAPQHAKTVAYVNTEVADSADELSAATSRYEDTPILDFIQNVQAETVDKALDGTPYADLPVLSIAAPFSRDAVFPQGRVKIKDIAGLYVFDNTLEAVTMTGAEIKAYLEYSAKYFKTVAPGAPIDVESGLTDPAVPDYNYDVMSGVDYSIDISQPVGSRIVGLSYNGAPINPAQEFAVALNNYRRSGGGGFPGVTKPQIYNQQRDIRQLLIDWATAKGTIDQKDFFVSNWRLVRDGTPVVFP